MLTRTLLPSLVVVMTLPGCGDDAAVSSETGGDSSSTSGSVAEGSSSSSTSAGSSSSEASSTGTPQIGLCDSSDECIDAVDCGPGEDCVECACVRRSGDLCPEGWGGDAGYRNCVTTSCVPPFGLIPDCAQDDFIEPPGGVCYFSGCESVCDCPAPPSAAFEEQISCEDIVGDSLKDCFIACGRGVACPDGMFCNADGMCFHGQEPPPPPPAEIQVFFGQSPVSAGGSRTFEEYVDVGATSSPVEVTVRNIGAADLTLGEVSLDATVDFALDIGSLDEVVAPGASTSFSVVFEPTNGGRKSVVLSIPNDDEDESEFDVTLTANSTLNTYRLLAPGPGPSARYGTSMVSLGDGRALLFGGVGADGTRLNDTWIYDVQNNDWTALAPTTPPPERDSHTMARSGDTVILYGGLNDAVLGDTWAFDVWMQEWSEITPAESPTGRYQASMVPIGDGRLMMFGGRESELNQLGETWLYDVDAGEWADAVSDNPPGPRYAGTMMYDGGNRVVLFGGYDLEGGAPLGDTWSYSVSTNGWVRLLSVAKLGGPGAHPGARFGQVGAYFGSDTFIVYGGSAEQCCAEPVPGTWAFYPGGAGFPTWTEITPAFEPAPRHQAASTYLEGTNKSLIFGGNLDSVGSSGATGELYEYVGP